MKRLIALISSVAIVLSFSSFAMASNTITTTYTAPTAPDTSGTFVTTVTGELGDQATLIAFPTTEGLNTDNGTNIEYIDQIKSGQGADSKTIFTYKFKTLHADFVANKEYTVKVGGVLEGDPLVSKVTPKTVTAPTTYTVSGNVTGAAAKIDPAALNSWKDQVTAGTITQQEFDTKRETLDAAWITTVSIIKESDLKYYIYNTLNPTVQPPAFNITPIASNIKATEGTGAFSLTVNALPEGTLSANYVLIVKRNGHLTYFKKFTFANADKPLGNVIELYAGDVEGGVNFAIDGVDITKVIVNRSSHGDGVAYNPSYDINASGATDGVDITKLVVNRGSDYTSQYTTDNIVIFGATGLLAQAEAELPK